MITPAQEFAVALADELQTKFNDDSRKEIFRELTVAGFCFECGAVTPTGACKCFTDIEDNQP